MRQPIALNLWISGFNAANPPVCVFNGNYGAASFAAAISVACLLVGLIGLNKC